TENLLAGGTSSPHERRERGNPLVSVSGRRGRASPIRGRGGRCVGGETTVRRRGRRQTAAGAEGRGQGASPGPSAGRRTAAPGGRSPGRRVRTNAARPAAHPLLGCSDLLRYRRPRRVPLLAEPEAGVSPAQGCRR